MPPTLLSLPGGPTEAEYVVNVSPEKLAKYLNGVRSATPLSCYFDLHCVPSPVDSTEVKFGVSDPESGSIYGYARRSAFSLWPSFTPPHFSHLRAKSYLAG